VRDNVKRFIEELLTTLFPRACPLCRSVVLDKGTAFCPACLAGFETIREPICSCCGHPLSQPAMAPDGDLCPSCLCRDPDHPAPLIVRSIAVYSRNVREAVLRVKFGRQAPLARSLSHYMTDHYHRFYPTHTFSSILPVPLHPKRLREREFNQCVLLARPLAARLGIPLDLDTVERVLHTPPQSASTEADRRKNLRGAFRVRRPDRVRGKSVLLVDDVYTTGATLEELAQALLSAGARRVCGFTLARSPSPQPPGYFSYTRLYGGPSRNRHNL
jgi:ComF family protein